MSVDVRNVPPWKLALLEKKRRQEDEERKRHREEEARLSRMPAWKRDIILKKQSQKNSVVFLGKESDKNGSDNDILAGTATESALGVANSAGVADVAWEVSTEAADGMGLKVGNGHSSATEGGAADEHLVPIQQNPWLKTDPLFKKHPQRSAHSSGSNSYDVADGYATEVVSHPNNNNEGAFEEEQEFSYGRGFVNKLLRKFTHLSSGEKVSGNLSPKHRSLSTESLLDESKSPAQVSAASRSISTSAISAIDNIPNDRLFPSHNSMQIGHRAASLENLSPVYSSVSLDATVTSSNIDKISIDESYSEKDSLNSSSLDDNRNNAAVTFEQHSQTAYINDNDVAMDINEYPKMNFVSATRSIFEVGSIKSPTQLSSKLNIYDGITEPVLGKNDDSSRGEWSPRTASTSCNGSMGSESDQTSLHSTPEKKAVKPVSDDALKNIRTAGKIWYSTPGDTSPVPDNDLVHSMSPAQALRPTAQTSYSPLSTSLNLTHERQEEVLSPPARKKRSAPKPPPAFAHDVSSGTKSVAPVSLDLTKVGSDVMLSPSHDRIQSTVLATPDSPSYKDLYFASHGKSKSEANVTLIANSQLGDGNPANAYVQREESVAIPVLKPRTRSQGVRRPDSELNTLTESSGVSVKTAASEVANRPYFEASPKMVILDSSPRTNLIHDSPEKVGSADQPDMAMSPAHSAKAPKPSSVPISPGSTTLISPRGGIDESPSFSSAKDMFAKEAANSKVIPLPRASPVNRPVMKPQSQPAPFSPSQPQPLAPPRRPSVERPNSIVGSNSKLTLEDVKRNHFNIESNKADKREARKKRVKSADYSSGPGTLLIRPASNLVATPGGRTGHNTHMDRYNDVRTGVFQPPKKRPTFYGAYDDDYEDIPVTNIDDVLDDSSSATSDTSSGAGQASSPRLELDADTHRRQISKKFDFVGAGVSLSRSLLVKTRKQKLSLSFDDTANSKYEYPSQQCLLELLPPEPGDFDYPNPGGHLADSVDDVGDPSGPNASLRATTGLAAGNLANYRSKASLEYEFGMLVSPSEPAHVVKPRQQEATPEEMQIKPAEDTETSTWSNANSSDMLF